MAWDTDRDLEVRHLTKKYARPKLMQLKQLAIDEIYLGKSVKHLSVVLDLDHSKPSTARFDFSTDKLSVIDNSNSSNSNLTFFIESGTH